MRKKWPFEQSTPPKLILTANPSIVMIEMNVLEAKDFYEALSEIYYIAAGTQSRRSKTASSAKAHAKAAEYLSEMAEKCSVSQFVNNDQRKAMDLN